MLGHRRGATGILLAAVALLITFPVLATEIAVTLRLAGTATRCSVSGFSWIDPNAAPQRIAIDPMTVDAPRAVTLARGGDRVRAVSTDCWAETAPVAESATAVSISLWPLGTVHGEVTLPDDSEAPRTIDATLVDATAARNADDAEQHSTDCSLQELSWRCAVPAGRALHLKIAVGAFAPVYVWDVEADKSPFDAGVHPLRRGAAVVGRVVSETGAPLRDARVTMTLMTSADQEPVGRRLTALETRSDKNGFFQLIGVPPGEYRLTSRRDGLGDVTRGPIELRRGQDLRLGEALVHAPLAELQVVVTPPVPRPSGRWRIVLTHEGSRLHERVQAADGPAGVEGIWTRRGLQPSSYELTLYDGESEAARQPVDLRSGGTERVIITVSGIDVRGKIVSGGEPVRTAIRFEQNGRRLRVETDEEGTFALMFPLPGPWHPSLLGNAGESEVRLRPVEIRSPHPEEVVIELPGGRVSGTVADADGRPLRSAVLLRRDQRIAAHTASDDEGKFEMLGLAAGSYTIEAEAEDGFAGPVPLSVEEEKTGKIELRIDPLREVSGHVAGADGAPASGAVVRILDPAAGGFFENAIADARGAFSARVRPGAEYVDVVVMSVPHPVTVRRFAMTRKRSTTLPVLQLGAVGGTLRLFFLGFPPWPTVVTQDGRPYSVAALLAPRFGPGPWRERVNGAFELYVEPGAYVVCNGTDCRPVQVAAHAVMTVDLRAPAKGDAP